MKEIGHFIGGRHVPGEGGRFGPIFNPAIGEQTGRVAMGGAAEVDAAVQAAKRAQPDWAASPLLRRMRVMFKLKELIERDMDELARMLSSEHGKVLADSRGDIQRGLDFADRGDRPVKFCRSAKRNFGLHRAGAGIEYGRGACRTPTRSTGDEMIDLPHRALLRRRAAGRFARAPG